LDGRDIVAVNVELETHQIDASRILVLADRRPSGVASVASPPCLDFIDGLRLIRLIT
jgi:hypothetical protein